MLQVLVLSLLTGLLVHELWLKVILVPVLLGVYAVTAFRFSRTARVIADIESESTWKWLYAPIFAFHFLLAAAVNATCALVENLIG